jgi:hypothetical protein
VQTIVVWARRGSVEASPANDGYCKSLHSKQEQFWHQTSQSLHKTQAT